METFSNLVDKNQPPATILLLDDHWDTSQAMRLILEAHGYQIVMAATAAEALAWAEKVRPQVVLSDIRMPKMDGFAFARSVRSIPAMRPALIIALSGYQQPGSREKALSAGFDAYFTKPLDFNALLDTIGKQLQERYPSL